MKWPAVEEVTAYRKQCQALINEVIDRNELVLPITKDSPWVNYMIKKFGLLYF